MGMIIKNGVEYNFGSSNTDSSSIEIVTQAEYDALVANGTMDNDKYYFITDTSVSKNATASDIPYDNTESGLEATDVQGAVDELKSEINKNHPNSNQLFVKKVTEMTGNAENVYSVDWQNYNILIFTYGSYNNIYTSTTVIKPYFGGTGSGSRPIVHSPENVAEEFEIWQNGEGSVIIRPSTALVAKSNFYVRIFGF